MLDVGLENEVCQMVIQLTEDSNFLNSSSFAFLYSSISFKASVRASLSL